MARTKKPGRKPLLPTDVNARQRRIMALKLRLEGLSQPEIAEAIGVNQSTVSRMIKQSLAEDQAESVENLRKLEYERMEQLHRQMSKAAKQGNLSAGNVIVRASERRSRLFGLDEVTTAGVGATLLSIWVEAIVVDSQEDIAQLLEAAERQGLAVASAQLEPGQIIHASQTHLVRLGAVTSAALDADQAAALISAAKHNEPWGI